MKSTRWLFLVKRNDINYLRTTIESYDGMAVVSTVDPGRAIIALRISPGCEGAVSGLIQSLRKEEGIFIQGPREEEN